MKTKHTGLPETGTVDRSELLNRDPHETTLMRSLYVIAELLHRSATVTRCSRTHIDACIRYAIECLSSWVGKSTWGTVTLCIRSNDDVVDNMLLGVGTLRPFCAVCVIK